MKLDHVCILEGHRSSIYTLTDIAGTEDFISAGGDGWIVRWNKFGKSPDGALVAQVEGKIFSSSYIAEKEWLLVGDMEGHLYWIDLKNNTVIKRIVLHKGSIFSILCQDDLVITAGADGYICCCRMETMLPFLSIQLSNQGLRCLEIVENTIWVGGSDGCIRILDGLTFDVLENRAKAHDNTIFSLCSHESGRVFSGGRDAMLTAWDVKSVDPLQSIAAHWYTINKIIGLPGQLLLTGSRDKTVRLWDQNTLELKYSADMFKGGHIRSVNTAVFLPESGLIGTAGDDHKIILWKLSGQSFERV